MHDNNSPGAANEDILAGLLPIDASSPQHVRVCLSNGAVRLDIQTVSNLSFQKSGATTGCKAQLFPLNDANGTEEVTASTSQVRADNSYPL